MSILPRSILESTPLDSNAYDRGVPGAGRDCYRDIRLSPDPASRPAFTPPLIATGPYLDDIEGHWTPDDINEMSAMWLYIVALGIAGGLCIVMAMVL